MRKILCNAIVKRNKKLNMDDESTTNNTGPTQVPPIAQTEGNEISEYLPYGGLILIILVAGAFYFFMYKKEDPAAVLPQGSLFLTLAPQETQKEAHIYKYDIGASSLTPMFSEENITYTASLSPNGTELVYGSVPIDHASTFVYPYSEFLQLYVQDMNTSAVRRVSSFTQDAVLKRHPAWSPNSTRIAYTAFLSTTTPNIFYIPNNWSVYVIDEQGVEARVGVGTHPVWSPNGRDILALINSGLVLYNLDTETRHEVFKFADVDAGAFALTPMTITVSDDKTHLAWVNPYREGGFTSIFSIESWDPFTMKLDQKLPVTLLSPVFSPDGTYLAGISVDASNTNFNEATSVGTENLIGAELAVYNLETKEMTSLHPLSEFSQKIDLMYVSDWIQ
jgi:Tol biopolymer transport system component